MTNEQRRQYSEPELLKDILERVPGQAWGHGQAVHGRQTIVPVTAVHRLQVVEAAKERIQPPLRLFRQRQLGKSLEQPRGGSAKAQRQSGFGFLGEFA